MENFQAIIFGFLLTIVHLFAAKITSVETSLRRPILSFASGASVSYIFIHLLPELGKGQEEINESLSIFESFFSHHVYLASLSGLAIFYGLERYINIKKEKEPGPVASKEDFWLHIIVFAAYNFIIGYILFTKYGNGLSDVIYFSVAMAFHFLINDYSLGKHHREMYLTKGRWILSLSVLAGCATAVFLALSEALTASLTAFLAGAIMLNILKEELPENNKSNFWAFLIGVALFSILLILSQ